MAGNITLTLTTYCNNHFGDKLWRTKATNVGQAVGKARQEASKRGRKI